MSNWLKMLIMRFANNGELFFIFHFSFFIFHFLIHLPIRPCHRLRLKTFDIIKARCNQTFAVRRILNDPLPQLPHTRIRIIKPAPALGYIKLGNGQVTTMEQKNSGIGSHDVKIKKGE